MTLQEAIAHAKEVASKVRRNGNYLHFRGNERIANECDECAKEYEQLADWLTELQERREADDISYEGMTVSEALHDLEDCVLPVVGGKSVRIAIKVLKAICERSKPCESEDK